MTTAIMEKPPTEGKQRNTVFSEEDDPRWAFMNPIQNSEAIHNKQYRYVLRH